MTLPTPGVTPANWGDQLNAEIQGVLPNTVSGLAAWYKGDAITGKVHNDQISQWDDSSGNGRHLTQATSGKQPIYRTSSGVFNGLPFVRFQGTDDTLTNLAVTGMSAMAGMTMLAVCKLSSGSGVHEYLHLDNTAGVSVMRIYYQTGWSSEAMGGGSAANGHNQNRSAGVRMLHYDGATVTLYGGPGAISDADTTGAVTTTRIFMGSYRDSANWLIGDVAEVCIYNRALTAAERVSVVLGLVYKYGLRDAA